MERSVNTADPAVSAFTPPAKKGGWITFPFILATMAGISLAFGGFLLNLEVYLIQEFNVKSISAAKVFNVINGSMAMLPIVAAIVVDSFLCCYTLTWISFLVSSLGLLLLAMTAAFSKLRPPPCVDGSEPCTSPSQLQSAVLYLSLALSAVGIAATRFTMAPMGACQFDKSKDQGIFFNWYTFVIYIGSLISSTAIVYVQDSVSWAWGFGICFAANTVGLVIFGAGTRFYRQLKPQGSPFVGLGRVVVASIRKRSIMLSQNPENYCQEHENKTTLPTEFFRFLNRAALKTEGDMKPNGLKSWKLSTVTEVEDFKHLLKLLPLWSTAFLISVPFGIQLSMTVIQALTMDRHLGHDFKIPAGSVAVFSFISTCITICFADRILFPLWSKLAPQPMTPLQRVGIGHLLNVLSMAASGLIETKRLKIVRLHNLQDQDNAVVAMSVFWLVAPLVLGGMGGAFHFPGHYAFYYQEFPKYFKSTSTAIVSLSTGTGFYLGNALIDAVQGSTNWLPDNINRGRLDNLYWLVAILAGINFCYFILCASTYKYKNAENVMDDMFL